MGVNNVIAFNQDAKQLKSEYIEYFDSVLCDAPCSGLGVVNDNPDIKLNRTSKNVDELNLEQLEILKTVSKYVKIGGYLYYSTCSLFECENDGVAQAFLKAHPEYTIEPIDSPLAHDKKACGLQFLPDTAYGAGFYVCKLVRKN